ncbi:MAG: hypothetical protein WCH13_12605, partial [Deltaproteobacteria bacterium]
MDPEPSMLFCTRASAAAICASREASARLAEEGISTSGASRPVVCAESSERGCAAAVVSARVAVAFGAGRRLGFGAVAGFGVARGAAVSLPLLAGLGFGAGAAPS